MMIFNLREYLVNHVLAVPGVETESPCVHGARRSLDPHHLAENGDRGLLRADVHLLSNDSWETANVGRPNGSYSGTIVPVNAPGTKFPSKLLFL